MHNNLCTFPPCSPLHTQNEDIRAASKHFDEDWLFSHQLLEDLIGDIIREDFAPDIAREVIAEAMDEKV